MSRVKQNRSDLPDQFERFTLLLRYPELARYQDLNPPVLIWIILWHSNVYNLKPRRIKTC